MALQGGHRFAVSMEEVFPHGLYAMGVEQVMDFDEKTKARKPAKDKVSGELVWTVTCIDRDPEARSKEVKVKVTHPYSPELPAEVLPGSGLRAVEFSGLTVTPYIEEGRMGSRPRLAMSFRAKDVHEAGKAPAGSAPGAGSGGAGSGRPSGQASGSGGDSKAA